MSVSVGFPDHTLNGSTSKAAPLPLFLSFPGKGQKNYESLSLPHPENQKNYRKPMPKNPKNKTRMIHVVVTKEPQESVFAPHAPPKSSTGQIPPWSFLSSLCDCDCDSDLLLHLGFLCKPKTTPIPWFGFITP